MAKYSDEYRATAIALLQAEGYVEDSAALSRVYDQLDAPRPAKRTLRYWFRQEHTPAPEKLISEKKESLADLFEQVAEKYVRHAMTDAVVNKANASTSLTAAGIAVDKMRLLRDLPTEIIGVLPVIQEAYDSIASIGEDPEVVFRKLAEAARKRADA